ncbi:methylmalonyl-CoA mutase subunit beta [Dactylosporangium sp. AC04546]|uniref:methylmalonyl-CoA mutase subunit beta n=1 Tax=Dactylosporangium sp. AC04546 TaxID=2862460 RepID=UPI001EDD1396|nr:methylmalonyl-CoA mutase subunit beta [Dactylosporangium sp. AC04546]WVK86097.1 methylmalonyl-CoA mutase subunit beta [Dactylosporangium sp. AC04546]
MSAISDETADYADWERLALGVLRKSGVTEDRPVRELLSTVDYSGVPVAPLYTADDQAPAAGLPGASPFIRGAGDTAGWDIRQRHADPDAKATREAILTDLENGVTSIWLAGIAPGDLAEVLDGVHLNLAPIVLDNGAATEAAVDAFLALPGDDKRGSFGADPLGWQARTGEPADLDLLRRLSGKDSELRIATVDATVYHDAGASDAEELGFAAATGLAYLRALVGAGLSTGMALRRLEFRYAATADQFATIAKLRAARRIWARIAQVCDVAHLGAQVQHAVTSDAMMTARDPWVNMLRTTLACFGAGVGGAAAVTVQPFDARLGLPDGFARRIARNTQSLLIEEAGVARVLDPAGGSWFAESLTDALAHAAWDVFTEVERAGGMAAALGGGLVAERIEATWQRRADNIAHRRDPITGVSEFPHLEERRPQRAPAPPPPTGGLPRRWYSEGFELLRDAAEAAGTPTVPLVTLGPPAAHSARASFAANLFAAGGIRTVHSGPESVTEGVACICGSDRSYADEAAAVAVQLKRQGVAKVWLAGPPAGFDGVDAYLFAGCDALDVLRQTHQDLGVMTP